MQIHIKKGDLEFGPYSRDQITSFLKIGFLKLSNLGSADGVNEWRKLANMEEFANVLDVVPDKNDKTGTPPAKPTFEKKKNAHS